MDRKIQIENLIKYSDKLVNYVENNFKDLLDEDVNILTNLLEVKLKKLFRDREKEKNKDEFFKYLEIALKNTLNGQ